MEYWIKSKNKDRAKICTEFFNKFFKKAEKISKKGPFNKKKKTFLFFYRKRWLKIEKAFPKR